MNPPTIIIGAGRSGTNALRNTLCSLDQFITWPCDEINYIWRQGNRSFPTDELTPAHATPFVKRRIAGAFERLQMQNGEATIVEKTCANSLRVQYVAEVFPSAKFIHIVRDGRDVTVSAMQRWKAKLDIPYLLKKARFVPFGDMPYYAANYLQTRIEKLQSKEDRLSWWGPKFTGIEELRGHDVPLAIVCATQWKACVTSAMQQLSALPASQVLQLSYETFVTQPRESLIEVLDFLGVAGEHMAIEDAVSSIRSSSKGNWRRKLSAADFEAISPIVNPMLELLGYEI